MFMEAGDAIVFVDCCCHGSAKRTVERGAAFYSLPLRLKLEPHALGLHALGRTAAPTEPVRGGYRQDHGREHPTPGTGWPLCVAAPGCDLRAETPFMSWPLRESRGCNLMRTKPTPEEIRQYRIRAFCPYRTSSRTELEQWRDAVDAAVAQRKEQVLPFVTDRGGHRTAEDQQYYERVFTQRINLWQSNAL